MCVQYVPRACWSHSSVRGAVSGVGSEWANVSAELFSLAVQPLGVWPCTCKYVWTMYCELVLWVNSDFRGCT